jgi:hypothetical protein
MAYKKRYNIRARALNDTRAYSSVLTNQFTDPKQYDNALANPSSKCLACYHIQSIDMYQTGHQLELPKVYLHLYDLVLNNQQVGSITLNCFEFD